MTVQTDEDVFTIDHRHAKLAADPRISPSCRRKVWIRKDVLGVHAMNRPGDPMFLWAQPEGYKARFYIEYPIHISHVASLRGREKNLSDLETETAEAREDLHQFLRFLKAQGAVPVDTA